MDQQPVDNQTISEVPPEPIGFEQLAPPPVPLGVGYEWFIYPNPEATHTFEVSLKLTTDHECSAVSCVRFSHDGKYLATGCNQRVRIYDTETGDEACVLLDKSVPEDEDFYIHSVCFSPDNKYLAAGGEDMKIRIWDVAKKQVHKYFDGHTQDIYSLDFSRDGLMLLSGAGDYTARIWDMETGDFKVLQITEPNEVNPGVTSVAFSPDARFVATACLDRIVRIWETSSGALIERLRGHRDSVYSVAFTPDGYELVSGSLDNTAVLWDLRPLLENLRMAQPLSQGGLIPSNNPHWGGGLGKKEGGEKGCTCINRFSGHKDLVLSVAVSPDGQWIVSGSKDRRVRIWDRKTAQKQLTIRGQSNSVISVDLSPVGGLLAIGGGDCQARICEQFVL